jgi:hypothetical protein
MDHLLTVIVTWLAFNFGLPANYEHPSIEFLPEEALHRVYYGPTHSGRGSRVVAVYDDSRLKILLTRNWKVTSPADVSVLVHEMVHHLQRHAGMTYACAAAREKLAFAAQAKWLDQFGTNLNREFELDDFTLKVITICTVP